MTRKRWQEEVGKEIGVSRGTMDRAAFIHEKDPQVAREIVEGKVSMTDGLRKTGWRDRSHHMGDGEPRKNKPKPRPEGLELAQLETMIEGKVEAFLDACWALMQIRDRHLFAETQGEFSRYLKERWGVAFQRDAPIIFGTMDAVRSVNRKES